MDELLETQDGQLAAIDQTTLTPLVRYALGSKTVEVVDWEYKQLHGGIALGTAVYRFSGYGHDQRQTIPWSLILKLLRPEGGSADASAWNYYKREVDAYQSGWLDDLPGGLVAPRSFGVVEHPDGTCWIWLEDIRDEFSLDWPLEHYEVVARHVGQFNGAYLVDRSLPSWSWLSSNWIRNYIEQSAPAMELLHNSLANPWARRWLPEDDCDKYFHLWAERELYLDALDRLPQTICHFDIFRRNLFAKKTAIGDHQTVLIDWAFVGRGPLGADLNPLVWMSIALAGEDLEVIKELEEIVFKGYLEGLREVGWQGDPQKVRLGYTAASTRYLFPEIERWMELILDESLHPGAEQRFGYPVEKIFDYMVLERRSLFGQLDEARQLIGGLG